MDRLKEILLESDTENKPAVKDRVEVVGLSIASCLNRASEFLSTALSELDYEVIERGQRSFLNLNPRPYRLLVSILPPENRFADLEEFSLKLGVGDRLLSTDLDRYEVPKDRDGRILVRVYRSGVYLTIFPPAGSGRPVELDQASLRISHMGVQYYNQKVVEDAVREAKGEAVKIAEYVPHPESDSSVKVEISPDEMKAFVRITPPKPGGRHLEVQDVVNALKAHGVVIGFMESEIHDALLEDRYMQDILAAQGQPARHGADARIDYKVKVKQEKLNFEEETGGRVDFKKMNLVENVVVGQILAEKVPARRGVPGRTLNNRIVDARDGKDTDLKQGRGTILSEDGMKLIAEINGQVVYSYDKISVEPIYRVVGDVGPKTGNIMFLGSVVITGNVLDNYEVKSAGNVDVAGAVQKARIEAEGDIVVHQGILGREEAHVETTGGNLVAKFIQSATVIVAGDVTVQEGILHSKVESGGRILCNGRRAQIVGGSIRATKEVRARIIGSQAYTATEITVGTDPRLLAQHEELKKMLEEDTEKLRKAEKSQKTLIARKQSDPESFTEEQQGLLKKNEQTLEKMQSKIEEIQGEMVKLDEFMQQLGSEGKVHAEKEIFPGVVVTIKDAAQNMSDTYKSVTLSYDNGYVKMGKLEKDEDKDRHRKRR